MDDKNSSNVQHPLHAALMIFHGTVRTAFETAAAFWRPWFREPEKNMLPQDSTQKHRLRKRLSRQSASRKRRRKSPRRRQSARNGPKILTQEATMEKKPKAATKRSLKDEQELEREDRAQKTDRLRKLRLAKEAADREKNPSSNGRDEAQRAIKE